MLFSNLSPSSSIYLPFFYFRKSLPSTLFIPTSQQTLTYSSLIYQNYKPTCSSLQFYLYSYFSYWIVFIPSQLLLVRFSGSDYVSSTGCSTIRTLVMLYIDYIHPILSRMDENLSPRRILSLSKMLFMLCSFYSLKHSSGLHIHNNSSIVDSCKSTTPFDTYLTTAPTTTKSLRQLL